MPRIVPVIILENTPGKHTPFTYGNTPELLWPGLRTWLQHIPHSCYPLRRHEAVELFLLLVQAAPDVFCIIGNAGRDAFYALETETGNRMRMVPLAFTETINRALGAASQTEAFSLSTRETEVLAHIAEGLLYKEVAEKLGISLDTVKKHLKNIYTKLQVQNRTQAVMKYMGYTPQQKTSKYLQS